MAPCSVFVSEAPSHSPRALVRPGRSRSTHRSSSRWRHQITAVWEAMGPRQPLRFLLLNDPGPGKTSVAGLFIKELIARGDWHRCLARCLARQPRCSLEGRLGGGGHQVEVSDLARRLVRKSAQLRPDAAVCSALAYSVPYKLSHADSRLPKEVTDSARTEFSNRGRSGPILAKLAGRRHRPRARRL
jgi:hypothetical protein